MPANGSVSRSLLNVVQSGMIGLPLPDSMTNGMQMKSVLYRIS